ncbi:MAG: hypothetical protein NVV73_01160 [Cellvibrionaceae bacterium]|nr:hypothetical protein [Cellvibrionaceae bacterium]
MRPRAGGRAGRRALERAEAEMKAAGATVMARRVDVSGRAAHGVAGRGGVPPLRRAAFRLQQRGRGLVGADLGELRARLAVVCWA